MQKTALLSYLMMALVGAMWGLHGPAIKHAFAAGFTFPQLVFWEYVVGSVVFCAAVVAKRTPWPTSPRFWKTMMAASVIGCGVPLFLFWAYKLGPVSIGATLLFLYVPFTQLLNFVLTRQAPRGREMAAAGLVILGAVVAADFAGTASAENLRGAPMAVAAAFCFATFFVLTARVGNDATPALRSLVCCGTSCLIITVIAQAAGWALAPAAGPAWVAAAWIIGLGIFGQVIPVFLLVHFGPRVGSGPGSILTSTELPVAVAASAIFLGDKVGAAQIAGVALVLVGIALPHLPGRRAAA